MRIDLRDTQLHRQDRPLRVQVDLDHPPTVIRPRDASPISLDWDRALDDERHLRHCPVCGCDDLFLRKPLPQITAFAAIVLAAIVAMVLFGIGQVGLALAVLAVVLAVDVAIFLFSPRVLECYRCRSQFRGMPIRKGHPRWESGLSERHRRRTDDGDAGDEGVSNDEPRDDAPRAQPAGTVEAATDDDKPTAAQPAKPR